VVDTTHVRDFDYRKKMYRERVTVAPRTVTTKVTQIWNDQWDEKSEKWAREMPEKFLNKDSKHAAEQSDANAATPVAESKAKEKK